MAIDPYTPCPGGTGKKVKFCCPDLLKELDKIHGMLEGEQRAACLDYIEKLEATHPERACLMEIKGMLQMQLGQQEKAHSTLETYMEKYPQNPVALAEFASMKVAQNDVVAAIEPLQKAIETCEREMPPQVYSTLGIVARGLLMGNFPLAARGHLMLQLSIGGGDEREQAIDILSQINGAPSLPLLFKQDVPLAPAPNDALWKKNFDASLQLAARGVWLKAVGQLRQLVDQVGDWPHIWRTIATLRAWLADHPGTVEALRKFAGQSVPLDDAVDAEALAQMLDAPNPVDEVDALKLVYGVNNLDDLVSRLGSHPSAERLPIDPAALGTADEPPPKAVYWLMDRPVLKDVENITLDKLPRLVGQAFLFGKQTDRDARLEVSTYRNDELATVERVLGEIAGDALGTVQSETVLTKTAAVALAMSANYRFPDELSPHERTTLLAADRRQRLLEVWPNLRQAVFDGKSPREVAGDSAYRIRLLAAILILETSAQGQTDFDYNQLRRELNLPTADPIVPEQGVGEDFPLTRLARLEMGKLSDDDLLLAYHRAEHFHVISAERNLAPEVLLRPSLDAKINKAAVNGLLAELEPDPNKAIGYIDEARKLTEKAGGSSATWDIVELTLRMNMNDTAEAQRLLRHIQREHMNEPGVAQLLMQVLVEAGVIHPDGSPVHAPQAGAGIVTPSGAPAAEPGKIWTPESDAAASGKKSALWMPGD